MWAEIIMIRQTVMKRPLSSALAQIPSVASPQGTITVPVGQR